MWQGRDYWTAHILRSQLLLTSIELLFFRNPGPVVPDHMIFSRETEAWGCQFWNMCPNIYRIPHWPKKTCLCVNSAYRPPPICCCWLLDKVQTPLLALKRISIVWPTSQNSLIWHPAVSIEESHTPLTARTSSILFSMWVPLCSLRHLPQTYSSFKWHLQDHLHAKPSFLPQSTYKRKKKKTLTIQSICLFIVVNFFLSVVLCCAGIRQLWLKIFGLLYYHRITQIFLVRLYITQKRGAVPYHSWYSPRDLAKSHIHSSRLSVTICWKNKWMKIIKSSYWKGHILPFHFIRTRFFRGLTGSFHFLNYTQLLRIYLRSNTVRAPGWDEDTFTDCNYFV